ncbi:acyl carrier protein [candidate division WOR-3 bacterium]|nr:acyl carrier protein [candidate division WOR-3 bacterium]
MYERVKRIVIKYTNIPEERITPEASFTDDLGVDSSDITGLIMNIEDEFGIDVLDTVERLRTVGDVVEHLRARLPVNE